MSLQLPIFLYDNLLKDYAVTVTSEDASYPKGNLYDDQLSLLYKPTSSGTLKIAIDAGADVPVDIFCLGNVHNLNTVGATISLHWSEDNFVNKLTNGDFETGGQSPWNFWTDATASFSASNSSPYEGSYKALITITDGGAGENNVRLYQGGMSIASGKKYMARFAAKAAAARTIAVKVQEHTTPYTNYGLDQTINLTTSWQIFELSFTSSGTSSDARLDFYLGGDNNDVELDEISFDDSVDAFTPFVPVSDNSYQYKLFTSVSKRYWRIMLSGMSAIPEIGEVAFGERYTQLKHFVGRFDDKKKKIEGNTNVSDGGQRENITLHKSLRFPCRIKRLALNSQAETDYFAWLDAVEEGMPCWFLWDVTGTYQICFVSLEERNLGAPINGAFREPDAFTLLEEL